MRLFAGLRELAGTRATEVELPEGATAADVWPALALGDEPPGLLIAVNKTYAARDSVLAAGDEVALIPPVSGGAFRLSEEPLSLDEAVREVASDDAGAIATFTGTTRAQSRGRDVIRLEYEAYEGMAEAEMERIAAVLKERYSSSTSPSTTGSVSSRSGRRASSSPSPPRTAPTRSPPARRRSTRSRARCRCGRRRSTSAARSGSGRARERAVPTSQGGAPGVPQRPRRQGWGRIVAPILAIGRRAAQARRLAQVPRHLPRARRLRAHLGLEVRRSASSSSSSCTSSATTSRRGGRD